MVGYNILFCLGLECCRWVWFCGLTWWVLVVGLLVVLVDLFRLLFVYVNSVVLVAVFGLCVWLLSWVVIWLLSLFLCFGYGAFVFIVMLWDLICFVFWFAVWGLCLSSGV